VSCFDPISFIEFDPAMIEEAVRRKQLLSMEIEFNRTCNFNCPYCYVGEQGDNRPALDEEGFRDVIRQARDLGARKIIVLGGEPLLYAPLPEMIRYMRGLGLDIEMFTNGTHVTPETARFFFDQNVKVVLKMNTRNPGIQDKLTGREGSWQGIRSALDNLKAAGYPHSERVMAVSTIICRDNIEELPDFWQWLRDQGIQPYVEMITPQGRASQNGWLEVSPREARAVFQRIAEIDRNRYGIRWDPQPPLVGSRCLRHRFSCLVNTYGDVWPCVGVSITVGNVRERPLAEILRDSEVIEDLRRHRTTMKGPCAACEKAAECYGCRGAAYQLTGDYLASDPLCWRLETRQDEIGKLPAAAGTFVPQQLPMRIVDTLMEVGERFARVECEVPREGPFVGADGRLDDAAYLEMIAQSIAALNGFRTGGNGNHQGLLLGAENLEVLAECRRGDRLSISVFKETKYGDFGVVSGAVTRGSELVARGRIKVWHKAGGGEEKTV
jgi:radical SAM protein with 4Fe4S-binding SPASM domain